MSYCQGCADREAELTAAQSELARERNDKNPSSLAYQLAAALHEEGRLVEELARVTAERDELRKACEQIQLGASSNAGRCMDCDSINSIVTQALAAAFPTEQEKE